jgi:hypothetical protein
MLHLPKTGSVFSNLVCGSPSPESMGAWHDRAFWGLL